jgi:hypothetical protein
MVNSTCTQIGLLEPKEMKRGGTNPYVPNTLISSIRSDLGREDDGVALFELRATRNRTSSPQLSASHVKFFKEQRCGARFA